MLIGITADRYLGVYSDRDADEADTFGRIAGSEQKGPAVPLRLDGARKWCENPCKIGEICSPSGIRTTSRGFRRVPSATDPCYFVRLFRQPVPD